MSSLPEEFDVDTNENDEMEPFNAQTEPREYYRREVNRAPSHNSIALGIAIASMVMSVIVFSLAVEKPANKIKSLFSGKSTSVLVTLEAQQTQLSSLQNTLEQNASELSAVKKSLAALQGELFDFKNELINNNSRTSQLERHYQELQSSINVLNKPKPAPKPIVIEKPKVPEKPPVLVSLLSIRIQGGASWVSLREGVEVSPLLAIGDEWHGAKLMAADPIKKEAQLSINGFSSVVKL